MTTWMCDNGHHGTAERRRTSSEPGERFVGMYTGRCAGSVYWIGAHVRGGEVVERDCTCDCHKAN